MEASAGEDLAGKVEDKPKPEGFFKRFGILYALLCAVCATLGLYGLNKLSPVVDSFEFFTSDWRTALFSRQNETQHGKVVVVLINDASLADLPYRSPIDRGFLSDVLAELDKAQPKVIGVDLFFDQKTEPAKDERLKKTFKQMKTEIVLGLHDEQTQGTPQQQGYNKQFVGETGRRAASFALRLESDNVIRRRADPPDTLMLFSEALAAIADPAQKPPEERRISWLRTPVEEETFLEINARDLLPKVSSLPEERREGLLHSLKGKVVIIGADLDDRRDRFLTPLSKLSNDTMLGPVVHAQITAQILDGRAFVSVPKSVPLALAALSAFFGFALGWRYYEWSVMTGVPPLILFGVLDLVAFSEFQTVLPFAIPAATWSLGLILGQSARWVAENFVAR